jgi:hypothetical protein
MKRIFSTVFGKLLNIKFHENQFSGSRVVPSGRTDRHDEGNSRFSQYMLHVSYFNYLLSSGFLIFPWILSSL